MKVYFESKAKCKYTAAEWKDLHDAVALFLDEHNMRHLKLVIGINMDARLPANTAGRMARSLDDYRVFRVDVDANRWLFSWVVNTLFHELTHVYQYASGKLTHPGDGQVVWKGDQLFLESQSPLGIVRLWKYFVSPWEVDARRNAAKMTRKFRQWKRTRNASS